MRWPWQKRAPEVREAGYTDALVRYLIGTADRGDTETQGSGAVEIAAGMIGRAFACAKPMNAGMAADVLTPECLQLIGREMVRTGEALHVIEVVNGRLALIPGHTWDVRGNANPATWLYRVDMTGPTSQTTKTVPTTDVVSCKWAVDPHRPWCGVSPLTFAHLSGQLHAKVVEALRDEAGGPRGHLLPTPKDPDSTLDGVAREIAGAEGEIVMVESGAGHAYVADKPDHTTWKPQRFGAAPGQPLVDLHGAAVRVALSCAGIPPELADAGVDATSRREAWRQLLHATLQPLGIMVADELRRKLELPDGFRFDWTGLAAGDTQGRARAFASLVGEGQGLDRAEALRLTGFTD